MFYIYYFLAFLGGTCIAIQSGVNSQLKQSVGNPFIASLISFVIGAVVLLVYSLVTGNLTFSDPTAIRDISWWKWTGGVLGAIYVTAVIISAPKIGAANVIGLIIAGQMFLALILDHFGLIGFPVHLFSLIRLAGAAAIITGVYLIQRF